MFGIFYSKCPEMRYVVNFVVLNCFSVGLLHYTPFDHQRLFCLTAFVDV